MDRQGKSIETGLAAALCLAASLSVAGCVRERPAFVLQPDRSLETESPTRYFTVTVRKGESLSEIAARCDVNMATVEDLNDIDPQTPLYPGQVLRVPNPPRAERHETAALHDESESAHAVHRRETPTAAWPLPQPKPGQDVPPPPRPVATANNDTAQPWWSSFWGRDSAPADAASAKFVWPVHGRVIEPFGRGANGERNDGINIATEPGEPIHAAGAGTVTYAGNELKGYGNLVLIKHSNGYVTPEAKGVRAAQRSRTEHRQGGGAPTSARARLAQLRESRKRPHARRSHTAASAEVGKIRSVLKKRRSRGKPQALEASSRSMGTFRGYMRDSK